VKKKDDFESNLLYLYAIDLKSYEEFKDTSEKVDSDAGQDSETEAIRPDQFKIDDDRIEYEVGQDENDKFSESIVSQVESSEVDWLWEYAQKFEGDQNINIPQNDRPETPQAEYEDESVQAIDEEGKQENYRRMEERQNIQNLVDATISAWSANPSMVKKELDKQYELIRHYKDQISDLRYQLGLKQKDLEKSLGIDSIRNLEKKKKELERQNVLLLEREKKRVVEMRLKEMQDLKRENKDLDMETRRLKLLLKKYKK
jgi:ribosome-binding protein aMBF1 (putative translation factor)